MLQTQFITVYWVRYYLETITRRIIIKKEEKLLLIDETVRMFFLWLYNQEEREKVNRRIGKAVNPNPNSAKLDPLRKYVKDTKGAVERVLWRCLVALYSTEELFLSII